MSDVFLEPQFSPSVCSEQMQQSLSYCSNENHESLVCPTRDMWREFKYLRVWRTSVWQILRTVFESSQTGCCLWHWGSCCRLQPLLLSAVLQRQKKYSDLKVAAPQCRNTLLQVKVMHLNFDMSKSAKAFASKYTSSWNKRSQCAEWHISEKSTSHYCSSWQKVV